MTYPALMSKRMTNKAAMPGGDSIDARETSVAEGFLGVSEAMMRIKEKLVRHLGNRGITACQSVDCPTWEWTKIPGRSPARLTDSSSQLIPHVRGETWGRLVA